MYDPKDDLFYIEFDEEDIDFQILVDNKSNDKNIKFSLELLNYNEEDTNRNSVIVSISI